MKPTPPSPPVLVPQQVSKCVYTHGSQRNVAWIGPWVTWHGIGVLQYTAQYTAFKAARLPGSLLNKIRCGAATAMLACVDTIASDALQCVLPCRTGYRRMPI